MLQLTFKQKIQFGYQIVKLKTLSLTAPKLAAKHAFKLFCTPFSDKPKRPEPSVFQKAERKKIISEGVVLNGFYWKASPSTNKTVLICHGFNSCSYKFAKYVQEFLHHGLNVLAFDAPAHGTSGGKQINALLYTKAVVQIAKEFGPLHGMMGHSFGGLAIALASEELQQPETKLVFVAPATETTTSTKLFLQLIKLKNTEVYEEISAVIERIGKKPISWYSVPRAIRSIPNKMLWFHDENDRICPFKDTSSIRKAGLKHLTFVATQQLGHRRIYHDAVVQKQILDFFVKD